MSADDIGAPGSRHEPDTFPSEASDAGAGSFTVEILKTALNTIRDEVRLGGTELETGGILLGHEHVAGCRILVAGRPGPNAVRRPLAFNRDLAYAQALADAAWDQRQAVWLGEWHTHPTASPVPSETDMASYARHLADPDLGFTRFISLVVGPMHSPDEPRQPEKPGEDGTASEAGPAGHAVSPVAVTWVVDREGARISPLLSVEEYL